MDYLRAKLVIVKYFLVLSAVLVLSCGQIDRHTQTDRITDAAKRLTHATTVGVSEYKTCCVPNVYFLR